MNVAKKKTREDVTALIRFIKKGTGEGRSLSELFSAYAKKTGKAKGSVRNRYYEIAAMGRTDEAFGARFLKGEPFAVQEKRTFTEREEDALLVDLFTAKKRGVSVRSALFSLAEGNPTLALRYQNKYRNLLTKNPSRVLAAVEKVQKETGYCFNPYAEKEGAEGKRQPLCRALNKTTPRERALALTVARLKAENKRLKQLAQDHSAMNLGGDAHKNLREGLRECAPAESKVKRLANALTPTVKTVRATIGRP